MNCSFLEAGPIKRPARAVNETKTRGRARPEVLVAEPDESVRRVICRGLRAAGIAAREASTAAQVRDAVAAGKLDVIVLNCGRLGETSGFEVGKWLIFNDPAVKLICIDGVLERAGQCGVPPNRTTRIVHKPFGPRVIVDHIFSMLARAAGTNPRN